MIKAVIFDCFGVLVTDGWHPFKHRYFANDPEKNAEASRLNDLTNKGVLGYQEFLHMIGHLAGISSEQVKNKLSTNAPNEHLFELITELKTDYKIGLLSNAAENWLDELIGPENVELFDEIILSCDISANKPSKQAYEMTAQKLGCELSECLFIDDIKTYVEAAQSSGMKTIHYTTLEQTISDIKVLLSGS